jgi:hypothetical protein
MNGGLEQTFIDLEEMLEDENFHSEAHIIMFVHEKLANGSELTLSDNNNGTYTITESHVNKKEVHEPLSFIKDGDNNFVLNRPVEEVKKELILPKGIEKIVVYKTDYDVIEELVEQEFGVPYSFLASEESGNDTSHEFTVSKNEDDGQEEVRKEIQSRVDRVKERIAKNPDRYSQYVLDYPAYDMLDYLCTKDIIPEGNYIVRVSY